MTSKSMYLIVDVNDGEGFDVKSILATESKEAVARYLNDPVLDRYRVFLLDSEVVSMVIEEQDDK